MSPITTTSTSMLTFDLPLKAPQPHEVSLKNPIIIADLHLSLDTPRLIGAFRTFMHTVAPRYDSLVILGDLFEVWVGDDDVARWEMVLGPIREYAKTHPVYIMHGNRDFMMGHGLAHACGAKLLSDPLVVKIEDSPVLLSHGDIWCTLDNAYQDFRRKTRTWWWQWCILLLPYMTRVRIGQHAREVSKSRTPMPDSARYDVVNASIQKDLDTFKVHTVIHGHTHKPGTYPVGEKATRYVIPDWRETQKGGVSAGGIVLKDGKISVLTLGFDEKMCT